MNRAWVIRRYKQVSYDQCPLQDQCNVSNYLWLYNLRLLQ
nr:MAG TPA: hypothetical protein [Caudoviricetes sp.]